jgi:phospholipid/cholesterol/gamma-HCH transport system ATP-binding protein
MEEVLPVDPREDMTADTATEAGEDGREVILSVKDLTVGFGSNIVLDKLNLDIYRGEILGFVGASGTGKSVLMRTVLRLLPRRSGSIEILGVEYDAVSEEERMELDMRLGVLFQHGALFSALTVKENIQVPMREYLNLPQELMDELARLKIDMVAGAGSGRQVPVRTVRRHDQACCAGARAGARSGPCLPRRTDLRAGSDRGG